MAEPVYGETFRVRASEMGPDRLLRLPALCDWLQEVAGSHAIHLGFGSEDLLAQGLTWVLSRLTLRVTSLPVWRSEARVTTWPAGALRLWALREFQVAAPDGAELARATSGWIVLKVAAKRPARVPEEVIRVGRLAPPRVLADTFEPLPAPSPDAPGPSFRVGRFDLDLNGHANNVAILRWLFEALPCPAGAGLSFEADFRGECFEGDLLTARVEGPTRGVTHVSLVRGGDGREVARARAATGPA